MRSDNSSATEIVDRHFGIWRNSLIASTQRESVGLVPWGIRSRSVVQLTWRASGIRKYPTGNTLWSYMDMDRGAYTIADESLSCRTVMPTSSCISSRDVGWRSLLLDVHSGVSSSEPFTAVWTPDPRIGVSLSGRYSAEVYTRGRWRHDRHTPGSITIRRTPEVSLCRFPQPKDQDYRAALIYIPIGQLLTAADHYRRIGHRLEIPEFNIVGRDPAIAQMGWNLYQAMNSGADDLYAETAAAWLAVHLLSRHGKVNEARDYRRSEVLTDARLARVIEYMSCHFTESITLERLAAEACISKYHFVRLFRDKVGQPPHRYLAELRLDAAQRMLISSELSIIEIAVECGFSSATHFTSAFTRRYGMPPTSWRNLSRH